MKNCGFKKGLTRKTGFMMCNKEKAKGSLSCQLGITENTAAFHLRISLHTEGKAIQMNSEYVNIPGFLCSVNLF
jgi:DNA-binding GntR family transcriptional regulator